jgi:hypothetical protein
MKIITGLSASALVVSSITLLSGCGGASGIASSAGAAAGSAAGSAISAGANAAASQISLSLTDAPIDDAAHVYVSVRGVSLNYEDSGWIDYDFDSVQKIDLLTLQSGNTISLLDAIDAEPGSYQVRLNISDDEDDVSDNAIILTEGGAEYPLTMPSAEQSGLKLTTSIVVPENGAADYTIDFDVRKSIVKRGQKDDYLLKPTLRLIDNSGAGSITGEITDTSLLTDNCSDSDPLSHNVIYVFEGANVTPDDIDSIGVEPVTTTPLVFDEESGVYSYTASFLIAGEYTVALTCNSDLEDIETDDALDFKNIHNDTVVAEDAKEDESDDEDEGSEKDGNNNKDKMKEDKDDSEEKSEDEDDEDDNSENENKGGNGKGNSEGKGQSGKP